MILCFIVLMYWLVVFVIMFWCIYMMICSFFCIVFCITKRLAICIANNIKMISKWYHLPYGANDLKCTNTINISTCSSCILSIMHINIGGIFTFLVHFANRKCPACVPLSHHLQFSIDLIIFLPKSPLNSSKTTSITFLSYKHLSPSFLPHFFRLLAIKNLTLPYFI